MDDDDLIARIADGDDTALRELFSRHAPWLAARLRSMLSAADVEDVLQETFLAVWTGARGYRPAGSAGGWVWGIARRQAALFLRRRGPVEDRPVAQVAKMTGVSIGTVKSRAHRARRLLLRAALRSGETTRRGHMAEGGAP